MEVFQTITVVRSVQPMGTASVHYTTTDGTAFANTNYTGTSGTLNFAVGQLTASFNVPVQDDGITNVNPFFFTVALSSPSAGANLGSPIVATNYIVDAQSFVRPPGGIDTSFNSGTGMNGDVLSLALQTNGQIVAGGNFTTVNGVPESYVARKAKCRWFTDRTGFLNNLAGANSTVYSVVNQSDDQILIGGQFTSINNVVHNHITRLNFDGSVDSSFNPGAGADNTVYAIAESFINGNRVIYAGVPSVPWEATRTPISCVAHPERDCGHRFCSGTGPNWHGLCRCSLPDHPILCRQSSCGRGVYVHQQLWCESHRPVEC